MYFGNFKWKQRGRGGGSRIGMLFCDIFWYVQVEEGEEEEKEGKEEEEEVEEAEVECCMLCCDVFCNV